MATRRPKLSVNDIVQVIFWDHAQGSDDVLKFEVFGRVVKVSSMHYTIDAWCYADGPVSDRDSERDNLHTFNILKAAIVTATVLVPRA